MERISELYSPDVWLIRRIPVGRARTFSTIIMPDGINDSIRHTFLSYFLLQCIKIRSRKKFAQRDFQCIAEFFNDIDG